MLGTREVMEIDDIRLDDPALRSDRIVQALVVATLLIAAIGVVWLVVTGATDSQVRHLPAVRVENQTHLPLQVSVFDSQGAQLTLGTRPPGTGTVFEVVDMGPTWTFVASYGGREVFRQAVPRSHIEEHGWSLVIPASTTADLERQGFR
jgi:hypothetical protein